MVDLGMRLDPSEYMSDFDRKSQLPPSGPGGYPCKIISSSIEESKKNSENKFIRFKIEVSPEGEGYSVLFDEIINLWNKNEKACHIARQRFSEIARCCGKFGPISRSESLHMIPFRAVTYFDEESGYQKIKHFLCKDGERPKAKDSEEIKEKSAPWCQPNE